MGGPSIGICYRTYSYTAAFCIFNFYVFLSVSNKVVYKSCVVILLLCSSWREGASLNLLQRSTRIAACSMENDFVDVFPSAGGVGDSPVKMSASEEHQQGGSSWSRPALSLSIPGLDSGGREALVSPAVSGSRGVTALAKEGALRSARAVSAAGTAAAREDGVVILETPSESPAPAAGLGGLMPLTIDAGGECIPTELEKKRAKLEKYRYECSEVG